MLNRKNWNSIREIPLFRGISFWRKPNLKRGFKQLKKLLLDFRKIKLHELKQALPPFATSFFGGKKRSNLPEFRREKLMASEI